MKLFVEGILEFDEIPEVINLIDQGKKKDSLLFFTSYLNFDLQLLDNFELLYPEDDSSFKLRGCFTIIMLTNQLSVPLETLESGYNGICQIQFDSDELLQEVKKLIPIVRNWYEYDKRFVFEKKISPS